MVDCILISFGNIVGVIWILFAELLETCDNLPNPTEFDNLSVSLRIESDESSRIK